MKVLVGLGNPGEEYEGTRHNLGFEVVRGVAKRLRLMRAHGMTATSWDRERGHASGYDVVERGYNYRPSELEDQIDDVRLASP